jgi:hypothetical protein
MFDPAALQMPRRHANITCTQLIKCAVREKSCEKMTTTPQQKTVKSAN